MDHNNPSSADNNRYLEIGRNCACYNLRKAARAITKFYDDFLRPSGLRTTQFSLLMTAKIRGPVTVTKLAGLAVLDRTTLSRNLTILEKGGLIKIEAGEDKRERQVSLTDKGEEKVIETIPLWEQAQALITEGMGEERVERFLKDISGLVSLIRSK